MTEVASDTWSGVMPMDGQPLEELQIRATECSELSDRISAAVSNLTALGVSVAASGRVRAAERLLKQIGTRGVFSSTDLEQREAANAVKDALEISQIAAALGTTQDATVIAQVKQVMQGTLSKEGIDRAPYQYQSQFVVGSCFAFSSAEVAIPVSKTDRSLPDFLVRLAVTRLPVEVKRPMTESGCQGALRKAVRQMRGLEAPGLVTFDLTDCLPNLIGSDQDTVKDEFWDLVERILNYVYDADRRRLLPGMPRRGLGIAAYATGWSFQELSTGDLGLSLYRVAYGGALSAQRGSVIEVRASELCEKFLEGMVAAGLKITELQRSRG